jgi:hypothetical protein
MRSIGSGQEKPQVPYLVDSTNIPTTQPGREGTSWQVNRLHGGARRDRVGTSYRESELVMLGAGKHAANLCEEGSRPEGLGEQRTGDISGLRKTGNEQHRRWRLEAGKVAGELQAVHPRHLDVGHDKAELPV